jgi:hypothetical protein
MELYPVALVMRIGAFVDFLKALLPESAQIEAA